MPALTFFIITFLSSICAGVLGALLGLGGGIIVIPILTLGLGVDIHFAIGASIVSVIATSSGAAATYVRDKVTNMRVGMFLEMATTTGAVTGAFVATLITGRALYLIFGSILAYRRHDVPQASPGDFRLVCRRTSSPITCGCIARIMTSP